ncbi:hypothetical protein B0I37DRAFT_88742 [Chaetomium sp. MPI-CAGE-AT-0009]|nr:hypothetical protein B0I37DRAFT_88742 [Chaetomium sp. MPI-CAGE-AT-0009]
MVPSVGSRVGRYLRQQNATHLPRRFLPFLILADPFQPNPSSNTPAFVKRHCLLFSSFPISIRKTTASRQPGQLSNFQTWDSSTPTPFRRRLFGCKEEPQSVAGRDPFNEPPLLIRFFCRAAAWTPMVGDTVPTANNLQSVILPPGSACCGRKSCISAQRHLLPCARPASLGCRPRTSRHGAANPIEETIVNYRPDLRTWVA